MKNTFFLVLVFMVLLLLLPQAVEAQCAMCKITAESGGQAADPPAPGLNQGILYLAAFPYLAFMVIAFLYWKGYKKRKAEAEEYGLKEF